MVEGVSWTYCAQCHRWTTGSKEYSTTTRIRIAVSMQNSQGANPPAGHNEYHDPPAGVLSQSGPTNNTDGGVDPKAIIAAYIGGYIDIEGDSVYDGGSISLMVHLFIVGVSNSESNPPTLDDVDSGTPGLFSDELFFSNEFRKKLEADAFYDAFVTLHKTVTITTDTEVTTHSYEPPPSDHPGNQDSE